MTLLYQHSLPGIMASPWIIPTAGISISSCASAQAVFASACTENCGSCPRAAAPKASKMGTSRLRQWPGGWVSKNQVKSAKETLDLDGVRMISDDLGVLRFFESEHVRIEFVQAKNCSNMYARIGLNMKKHTGSNDRAFNQEHMSFSKKEIVK